MPQLVDYLAKAQRRERRSHHDPYAVVGQEAAHTSPPPVAEMADGEGFARAPVGGWEVPIRVEGGRIVVMALVAGNGVDIG